MRTSFSFFFGLDYYKVKLPFRFFLNQCKENELEIYQCNQINDGIEFYCPIGQRKKILKTFPNVEYIKTIGCVGFLFRQLKKPFRLVLLAWCCFLYFIFNHIIFSVEYQSTSHQLENKIQQVLLDHGYQAPFFSLDQDLKQTLKDLLKDKFNTEIAWLEVTRKGSKIQIAFNDKQYKEITSLHEEPLIATKDALVVRFDVTHGQKKVKLNQIVHKGDILVDHILIDAYGQAQNVFVEGKVWGKTWTTIERYMPIEEDFKFLKPFHFLRLLYDARREIEKQLDEEEYILKENILQFTYDGSKITLIVHYTCLEDITKP